MKRHVETANRQVSDLCPAESLSSNKRTAENEDKKKEKSALLRVAMEKEQIQRQFKELQKKFQMKTTTTQRIANGLKFLHSLRVQRRVTQQHTNFVSECEHRQRVERQRDSHSDLRKVVQVTCMVTCRLDAALLGSPYESKIYEWRENT